MKTNRIEQGPTPAIAPPGSVDQGTTRQKAIGSRFLPIHFGLILLLGIALPGEISAASARTDARPGRIEFDGCYASWSNSLLVVGNTLFERKWVLAKDRLVAASWRTKQPDTEWLQPTPAHAGGNARFQVEARTGRRHVVEAASLQLAISVSGATAPPLSLCVFPGIAGVLWQSTADDGTNALAAARTATPGPGGVESNPASQNLPAGVAPTETLTLAPGHLRLTQVSLTDQTDEHNELVTEREWLLHPREAALRLSGNLIFVENTLTGAGLVCLKLAPLPHARRIKADADFTVQPGTGSVQATLDYPVATLAYQRGRIGRIAALHAFQRQLRAPDPARDGLFLSNTWGDRSRDARINEAFILKEIEAGARLGVEVVQIDDGWQQGRTKNSASAAPGAGGVWGGWWAADPHFWDPDPKRFPNGLAPLAQAARNHGMKLGLWFAPDSSRDAANWRRDADRLLELHRDLGVDYFKIDSLRTATALASANQQGLFDRVLSNSQGRVVFDLDVTADIRPGYFGLPEIGPLFVENRYTDWHSYWPHYTLRNLWQLAQYVDPLRLRIELLNPTRNADKYPEDQLAPAHYRADTLFAMTMVASPLGWFEVSNLPESFTHQVAPLAATWKHERARLHGGTILPIGQTPDGTSWTGFASVSPGTRGGYVLLFRELNKQAEYRLELGPLFSGSLTPTILGGRGTAACQDGQLRVQIPAPLDFLWIRLDGASEASSKENGA